MEQVANSSLHVSHRLMVLSLTINFANPPRKPQSSFVQLPLATPLPISSTSLFGSRTSACPTILCPVEVVNTQTLALSPILPNSYKKSDFVMLGNLTPAIQEQVLNQLSSKDDSFVALDTMNFWMDIALDKLLEVISHVDVLIINDEEARQLSNEFSLVNAAKIIHKMGPRYLIIKKGEHGAMLFNEEKMFFAPGLPLAEVKDPTGAGDTFAGGFMGYLAKTNDTSFENMKRALIYGSTMASFCVQEFGIENLKNLNEEKINERVKVFSELVKFDI